MQNFYPDLPILTQASVILASASPRRRELLERLLPAEHFQILAADIDESIHLNEDPSTYVGRLAQEKAAKSASLAQMQNKVRSGQALLSIGADTSVVLDGKIYGKPSSPADAVQMLHELTGHTHQVMTSICIHLVQANGEVISKVQVATTDVEMQIASENEIAWYVATGEPLDKAGAYAIQGYGGVFIKAIKGDYYNVVGLPLVSLITMLRQL
jgi:septum formation protein